MPEQGVTTLVTHFSWTIKLQTTNKKQNKFTLMSNLKIVIEKLKDRKLENSFYAFHRKKSFKYYYAMDFTE